MSIYLDNSATTQPYKEVVEAMVQALTDDYYNPSAAYRRGLNLERKIKSIREDIAKILGVRSKEIYFSSGGTESNNMIIKSIARANKRNKKHIITTAIEHPSVLNTFYDLEREGFEIDILPVDREGKISIENLKNTLREDTILVSCMHVNNEIGVINDLKQISKAIKNFDEEIVFHVDGVQSFGKISFKLSDFNIDAFSASGHKLHGPKGIGFAYIKEGVKLGPLISGGGQESGLRSGTENVPGIYGLSKAVEILFDNFDEKINKMKNYRDLLEEKLKENIDDIKINSSSDGVCHILNVSFEGIRGEVLLHFLENDDISVSTGSACSSKKKGSHVLNAMGLSNDLIDGAVRFSISDLNEIEEIDIVVSKVKTYVEQIRKISAYNKR